MVVEAVVGRPSAVQEVVENLRRQISDGTLPPGQRLPAERDFAEQMGVHRRIIRQALAILAEEGSVSRQVGRGTFVGRSAFGPEDAPLPDSAAPMELMEARLAIEPVIAAEAALRAKQADLRRMRMCLKRGEEASDFTRFENWDAALHRSVAEATQNVVFVMIIDMFARVRASGEWDRLKRLSLSDERQTLYRRQHEALVEAIELRDPKQATSAMREHLRSVQDALSGVGA